MAETHKIGAPRRIPIRVRDGAGRPVTKISPSSFSVQVLIDDFVVSVPYKITEVDAVAAKGRYSLAVTPWSLGSWEVYVSHKTYNVAGWSDAFQVTARGIDDLAFPSQSGVSVDSLLSRDSLLIFSGVTRGASSNQGEVALDATDPAFVPSVNYGGCAIVVDNPIYGVPQLRYITNVTSGVATVSEPFSIAVGAGIPYRIFSAFPVGVDWANIYNPSASATLSNTTILSAGAGGTVNANVVSVAPGALSGETVAGVSGAVGSVTNNVGGNVLGSVIGSVASVSGNVNGSVGSVVGNIGGVLANLGTGAKADVAAAILATPANLLATDASGRVNSNVQQWLGSTPNALVSSNVPANVKAVTSGALAGETVSAVSGNVGGSVASVTGNIGGTLANLASGAKTDVENAVWDAVASSHIASGSLGEKLGALVLRTGTAQAGSSTSITLDAGSSSTDNTYRYCLVFITSGPGSGQVRLISSYFGASRVATISQSWPAANPTSASTFAILPITALPIDWSTIASTNTSQNLAATTIATSQVVASVSGAVGNVTGNVGGNVVGSVGSVTGAVGSVVGAVGSVAGNVGGNVTGSTGSVVGNVGGNVVGSVGSVTGAVGGDVSGKVLGGGAGVLVGVGVQADLQTWKGSAPANLGGGGNMVIVDVESWKGNVPNGLVSGNVQSDVESWITTPVSGLSASRLVKVDVEEWKASAPNALIAGRVDSNAQVVGDKTGYALTAAEEQAIADAVLSRDLSNVEATAGQHTLAGAAEKLTCRVVLSPDGTTLTVYRTNGTTVAYTQATTTNPSAPPVTSVS